MVSQNNAAVRHIRRRIVMLDDLRDVSRLSLGLEALGHTVRHLAIGTATASDVIRLRPDAILLNLGPSQLIARKLVAELRKVPSLRRAQIIAISRFEEKTEKSTSRREFDHYFTIPADAENLLAVIEKGAGEPGNTSAASLARCRQGPPRLLLVEDNAPLAEATAEFLRSSGLEVRIAECGEDALLSARAFRPEIVLCDLCLPDMSGLDVARRLHAAPGTKDILVAMHSALSDMDIRAFELEFLNEVNLFLSKPLNEAKLNRILGALDSLQRSARQSA